MEDPGTPIPSKMSTIQASTISTTAETDTVTTDEELTPLAKTVSNSTLSTWNGPVSLPDNCTLASSKDNAYFHALFKSVPGHDRLLEVYKCALHRDILLQGHLYLSEHYVCFHANIFGWITNLVIEFNEITLIERKMTAMIIPNGIQINTQHAKHTFASFIFREAAYQQLTSLWALHQPQKLHSSTMLDDDDWTSSSSSSDEEDIDNDDDSNSVHTSKDNPPDTSDHLSSYYPTWKGILLVLLFLHSGWMLRQWLRLGNQLQRQEQQHEMDEYDPIASYFGKSQEQHRLYGRLDQLRQRMETLNQQIMNQQSLLYELSPHEDN
ncbi:GRAM domain-containing protein [Halteromyces radiatus]|uniref:GRAM domain-containing protein n=1 Tax=Halteromyces radiatus TaxID=101107 RepID=UPI00221E5133|nr:GRAM domain-containing protein [Halteromyces radiatus]KAI8089301.1 GRAM domain-containing protein [Halteromyces radiatus]